MKQFVAMTDDVLYRGDGPPVPLVPYQCGVFCWHRLREQAGQEKPMVDRDPAAVANGAGDVAALSA